MTVNPTTPPEEQEPKEVLEWCRQLVRILKDGGVWGIPRSGITFRVDKQNKKLILVIGNETDDDFIATKRVFKQIGWEVTAEQPNHGTDNRPGFSAN
jgi:hypothetical protein